jgi:hypothetical protein
MPAANSEPIVISAGGGTQLKVLGVEFTYKLTGEQTQGHYALTACDAV